MMEEVTYIRSIEGTVHLSNDVAVTFNVAMVAIDPQRWGNVMAGIIQAALAQGDIKDESDD